MRAAALALLLTTAFAPTALAQAPVSPTVRGQPYAVPRSEVRDVTSKAGEVYRLFISRPDGPAPAAGWPVLYILDGEDSFGIAAETANRLGRFSGAGRMSPGVVVAIGYVGQSRRSFDYTPPAPPVPPAPGDRVEKTGGADLFLDFITREVRPLVEADYPIDKGRQALMGHSYGGLFVLHTLFNRPEAFQTYIASSPSIWFADQQVLKAEPAFAERIRKGGLKRRLVVTVGEYEQAPPPWAASDPAARAVTARNASRLMVDNARDLAARIKPLAASGLAVDFRLLSGENHGSAVLPAVGNALPFAFGAAP
ncbi:MAG: alpha/beta hydrolase-fold protein [Pseudomonadota bacterium]